MPEKTTKDFIHIPAQGIDDSQFVAGFGRIITIDKSRGVKANLGKLKSTGKTRIRSYLFPTKNFTKQQARDWVKSHSKEETDMENEEILLEAVWTQKYVNDLNDGSFLYIKPGGSKDSEGKTKPRSLRMFPYKDAGGKVDLPHLRNALARIPQSNLPADVKRRVAAKARRLAKGAGIDVSDEYLDPVGLRFPISEEDLVETLVRFNSGEPIFFDYTAEQIDYMGRKLARTLNKYDYNSTDDTSYDEDGSIVRSAGTHSNRSENRYEYRDGQIVVVRNSSDGTSETTWDYSEGAGAEEDVDDGSEDGAVAESDPENIFEAQSTGDMIKAMRMKKKMSRTDMAAKMNMSKSRLTEIEDGVDEPDDGELNEIAGALGMTPKRMRKMMDAMMGGDEEDEGGVDEETQVYEIVDSEAVVESDQEIYDVVEIAENVIETAKTEERKEFFTKEIYEERIVGNELKGGYRFLGNIVSESIKRNNEGTVTFEVPLFKIGELTSNGNRYTQKCAEHLVDDLDNLLRKTKLKEDNGNDGKRRLLDIEVVKYLEGRKPDMMATHRARLGDGNPILEKAGRILGGRIGKVEGDPAFILRGETLREGAGKIVAEQIEKDMLRGVSLFAFPFEFEENGDGGADVDHMAMAGTDFTDDGGNLIQFKDKKNAGFAVLN